MEKINFICYKAYPSIDLKSIASFYGLQQPEDRDRCAILKDIQLEDIYKCEMQGRKIYVFSYGCIVFEGMELDDADRFFESLRSVLGEPDYKMLARYRESHAIFITDEKTACLWDGSANFFPLSDDLTYSAASILAKSTALAKEESDIDTLLDEADSYIARFQNRLLDTGARRYAVSMAHIIRFEKESAAGIRIFDRPAGITRSLLLRDAYDKLSDYFELADRYEILEKKAAELRNIVRSHSMLRYRHQENRLLAFEIFLLLLFPLFRILESIIGSKEIEGFFRLIFSNLLQKFNIFI